MAAAVGYVGLFWHKVKAFVQRLRGKAPVSVQDDPPSDDPVG